MEINRLLSDELSYELLVRGAVTDGTVEDKRQRLRTFMRLERSGDLPITSAIFMDPESEIQICDEKLLGLYQAMRDFDSENAVNERARFHTRLLHVLGRLGRICDGNVAQVKAQLITRCAELMGSLEDPSNNPGDAGSAGPLQAVGLNPENNLLDLGEVDPREPQVSIMDRPNEPIQINDAQNNYEVLSRLTSPAPEPLIASPLTRQSVLADPVAQGSYRSGPRTRVTFGTTEYATSNMPQHSSLTNAHRWRPLSLSPVPRHGVSVAHAPSMINDPPPVRPDQSVYPLTSSHAVSADLSRSFGTISKWNLKFTGQGSVTNFVERAEELAGACGLSDEHLFNSAIIFFADTALSWFRSVRSSVHSWEELKAKLKTTYLPPEYEEDIWSDIRNRTQGPCEKTAIFIAQMRNLFGKLLHRPSEEAQSRIIRRNLLPDLQTQLALQSFHSVDELEAAAQSLENVRLRVQRMRPPPSNPSMVTEPECMYQRPRGVQLHATAPVEQGSGVAQPNPAPGPNLASRLVCWNCREPGHLKRNCTRPFQQHCFRCGRQNVTTRSCPRCNNASGNGSTNH